MEIEDKIIVEINKLIKNSDNELDEELVNKINKLLVCQSVKVSDKDKKETDAITFIENKIFDLIKK